MPSRAFCRSKMTVSRQWWWYFCYKIKKSLRIRIVPRCRKEYNKDKDLGNFEKAENYWIDFQGNAENAINWMN
ncbi:MAG: hypothetical protein AAB766_01545, partial [Patescibacteria group bacterium]